MNSITKILLLATFIGVSGIGIGQNLVPNPSFEDYSLCPNNWDQFDRVDNWSSYKQTPDYFNSCDNTNEHSTPSNMIGHQIAHSGNAYAGLIFYEKGGESLNEMIGTQLKQPLAIGTKYFISFKVVLKYNNSFGICCGQNKIGIKFSSLTYTPSSPPASDDSAHIYSNIIISDTTNWVEIFGSFVADSAYTNIIIGNFYNNSNVAIDDIIPSNFSSYYYVDDVCVSTDSTYALNYIFNGIDSNTVNEVIKIYPNPASNYFHVENWDSSNPISITLYNSIGQKLYGTNETFDSITKIDISKFNTNLIYVVINYGNKSLTQKLIKL